MRRGLWFFMAGSALLSGASVAQAQTGDVVMRRPLPNARALSTQDSCQVTGNCPTPSPTPPPSTQDGCDANGNCPAPTPSPTSDPDTSEPVIATFYTWDTRTPAYSCDSIDVTSPVICREISLHGDFTVSDRIVDDALCIAHSDQTGPKPVSAQEMKDSCEHPPQLAISPIGPYKAPHVIGGGDYPETHMPYPSDPAAYCTTKSYRQVSAKCMQGDTEVDISRCRPPSGVVASDDGTFWQAGPAVTSGCTFEWVTSQATYYQPVCQVSAAYDSTCVNTNSQYGSVSGYDFSSQGPYGYENNYASARCTSPHPAQFQIDPDGSYNAGVCINTRVLGPWQAPQGSCGYVQFTRQSRCERVDGKYEGVTSCGYDGESKTGNAYVPCFDGSEGQDSGSYVWATGPFDFGKDFYECGDNVGTRRVACVDEGSYRAVDDSLCANAGDKPAATYDYYKVCPYTGSGAEQPK